MYIVEIEPGVWLATWQGDPGRTLVENSAKKYPSARSAFSAIARACMYRNFDKAVIHPFHIAQQPQGATREA